MSVPGHIQGHIRHLGDLCPVRLLRPASGRGGGGKNWQAAVGRLGACADARADPPNRTARPPDRRRQPRGARQATHGHLVPLTDRSFGSSTACPCSFLSIFLSICQEEKKAVVCRLSLFGLFGIESAPQLQRASHCGVSNASRGGARAEGLERPRH